MHKAGFVNIVGNPNVGKSTLMNSLVGERISIITSKAQTTRHRIMGIVNTPEYQIVFSDTPGVLSPKYKLQESMLSFSEGALTDADELLYVTDVVEDPTKNAEFLARVAAENVAEVEAELRHVQRGVLDAVAAEHGIKAHNKERRQNAEPAEPAELFRHRLIRGDNALASLAAEGKLAAHDDHADKYRQQQIDKQEGKASAFTHFVGEAPDVPQTDGRADSRHDEAECASP